MRLFTTLFCMIIMMLAAPAAGEEYSLDDCIRMALEKNPDAVASRNAVSSAGAAVWNQAGQFLPSLSVGYTSREVKYGPESPRLRKEFIPVGIVGEVVGDSVYGNLIYQDTVVNAGNTNSFTLKNHTAGVELDYTLFNGLRNVWNYLGSRASKRQAERNLAMIESDITYNVKAGYYLVLKAKNDYEVAQEAVERSDELLKLFQEKYNLGSASLSEVLKQKVQYGNDKLTEVRAANNLEVYYDNLAVAVGLDPQEKFEIEDIEMRREEVEEISTLIHEARQWHPRILAARAATDAAKYDVRSAWGAYLPTLSMSYSYGWQKDHFSDIVKGGPFDHTGTLVISLSYNIFDGFSRERNLKRAKIGSSNSRAEAFYIENQVIRDIEDAYLGIKLAEETLEVTGETERAAKEDFELVQEKYNLGAAALWELLDAQVSLKEAQFNRVKAEFDYNLALAQLQNAMGN